MDMEHQVHEFEPVFNRESRILILGTFPSVKSRQSQFYYGHPQNRFWKVLAGICKCSAADTSGEKRNAFKKSDCGLGCDCQL